MSLQDLLKRIDEIIAGVESDRFTIENLLELNADIIKEVNATF